MDPTPYDKKKWRYIELLLIQIYITLILSSIYSIKSILLYTLRVHVFVYITSSFNVYNTMFFLLDT